MWHVAWGMYFNVHKHGAAREAWIRYFNVYKHGAECEAWKAADLYQHREARDTA